MSQQLDFFQVNSVRILIWGEKIEKKEGEEASRNESLSFPSSYT